MEQFKQNIINIHKEQGRKWLNQLPTTIKKLSTLWNLKNLSPLPNLSYHYVLSGLQAGLPIILKIYPDSISIKKETKALNTFMGFGAVKILEHSENALLLERAIPGTSLKEYFPKQDELATTIFCKIIQKLHQVPNSHRYNFPHISQWLSPLDKNWDIPKQHLEKARVVKKYLLANSDQETILHGDLHHENILKNNNEWIVIDPKGVVGETAFELATFIYNPIPDLISTNDFKMIIAKRINICSKTLNINKEKIIAYCFIKTVLSQIWSIQDNNHNLSFKKLSDVLIKML